MEGDQYDPVQTVSLTQKLVEQDNVFAIFNSIGTEHALAVRKYLNDQKVPQLFVGSGASLIASQRAQFPWTIGLLPSFPGEGAIYGRQIVATKPKANIVALYEGDEYGNPLLSCLTPGLDTPAAPPAPAHPYPPL